MATEEDRLSPEKRITKRRMKQDKLVSTAFKAAEYAQKNKKYFIGGISAVVLIALVVYFVNLSISRKEGAAQELLGRAQLASAMQQPALAAADFQNIIEEYGSTPAAKRAMYFLAKLYYDQQKCDSAVYYYENYIQRYAKNDDEMLASSAYAGAATCLENTGDYAKAGEYYMKAAEAANNELHSPGYYMNAGRAFDKAEQYDQAQKAYQAVVDKYSRSPFYSTARKKLAEVEYKLRLG